mmetsp:Transcript_62982/g.126316  ORF Transcript_62982/g.126316 Transcript_62982/m.126316 type:complete len:214 (-) Transcript_62982:580-1221(-)
MALATPARRRPTAELEARVSALSAEELAAQLAAATLESQAQSGVTDTTTSPTSTPSRSAALPRCTSTTMASSPRGPNGATTSPRPASSKVTLNWSTPCPEEEGCCEEGLVARGLDSGGTPSAGVCCPPKSPREGGGGGLCEGLAALAAKAGGGGVELLSCATTKSESAWRTLVCPISCAIWAGVQPSKVGRFTSAPNSPSRRTTESHPLPAAT